MLTDKQLPTAGTKAKEVLIAHLMQDTHKMLDDQEDEGPPEMPAAAAKSGHRTTTATIVEALAPDGTFRQVMRGGIAQLGRS
jgi:hypothetical protein